jgi:hypothetical protein
MYNFNIFRRLTINFTISSETYIIYIFFPMAKFGGKTMTKCNLNIINSGLVIAYNVLVLGSMSHHYFIVGMTCLNASYHVKKNIFIIFSACNLTITYRIFFFL